ncbi:MAG: DNA-3-methyladenine glycosylase I [Desulfobacteraceae bacterium]|nr:DNA-3-methyladenine glycosylase I [Desulfobacteraceae bacterium]MDD3993292.1 DNA-3-methyladenine glycosylase I [Desulfobacteraceae bacterium]
MKPLTHPSSPVRCPWPGDDPLYVRYHDEEWGVPLHDDHRLFEALILDGAQAGLSWLTILKKRDNYRRAFEDFDPARVARYGEEKIGALMADAGIVRNRRKIDAAVTNARACLEVQAAFGSLDAYLWRFVEGKTVHNAWRTMDQVPAETAVSRTMSRDLKQRGFAFVGPTICYALMQAVGMVNDHLVSCFRHAEIKQEGK